MGDFQWHTGPQTKPDDFYAGDPDGNGPLEINRRDVAAVGIVTNGQTLCFNGKTTHKHCQGVRDSSVCAGTMCHLVQMGSRVTNPGDSGGPWFYGNSAYGIHYGLMYDPFWPYDRDIFSKASLIDDAMGVEIRR